MADKGKKGGKPAAGAPPPPPGGKKEGEQPPGEGKQPPGEGKGEEKKGAEPPPPKPKSVQPKDEVGTRKGCRRYKWELKDSNKEFWVMGHAEVKILSVGCLIAALVMFTGTVVHPLLTLIISMELSVFLFFIIVYSFAINRYMPFILWPITDLLNDLFATAFLAGATAFAVQTRQTMPMNYFVAVILIGVAAFFPLIDICLQRKHFRGKKVKRNVLVPPQKKADAAKAKEEAKSGAAKPKEDKKGKPAAAAAAKPGKK
ncbi:CKLF-like MARVEL transmembrane domain-containing protein 2 [Eptesicus fuscus]|uniref:CKLF-like MARVEL transmembrane domain-containing protein 2 n=1 Tax=Eptesicus fuscus TaxID=29078 RepID=UPI00046BC65B|nr:CKLF-like MARVEL transmembrane domain-containing protein 2 [Eptesicus fuscus]